LPHLHPPPRRLHFQCWLRTAAPRSRALSGPGQAPTSGVRFGGRVWPVPLGVSALCALPVDLVSASYCPIVSGLVFVLSVLAIVLAGSALRLSGSGACPCHALCSLAPPRGSFFAFGPGLPLLLFLLSAPYLFCRVSWFRRPPVVRARLCSRTPAFDMAGFLRCLL